MSKRANSRSRSSRDRDNYVKAKQALSGHGEYGHGDVQLGGRIFARRTFTWYLIR